MVVRVRVKLKSVKKEVVTVALANSGFETEEPEVVLPTRAQARRFQACHCVQTKH